METAGPPFRGIHLTDAVSQVAVPRGGHRQGGGESRGASPKSPRSHAERSVGHAEGWDAEAGAGGQIEIVVASEQVDFLFQRHAADEVFGAFAGRKMGVAKRIVGFGSLCLATPADEAGQGDKYELFHGRGLVMVNCSTYSFTII